MEHFATTYLHPCRFSVRLKLSASHKFVHSLLLSSHRFRCLPLRRLQGTLLLLRVAEVTVFPREHDVLQPLSWRWRSSAEPCHARPGRHHGASADHSPSLGHRMDAQFPPYKNGTSCSDCPEHCVNGTALCDCGGRICFNGGNLDPATCECQCTELYSGENCTEKNCAKDDRDECGFYTAGDCRVKDFVKDPSMCPHLCGICPACNGTECQNGGTLDNTTCTCYCPAPYGGDLCEQDCSLISCLNGGTPIGDTCKCSCESPYVGDLCDEDCSAKVCDTLEEGVAVNNECQCQCQAGYFFSDMDQACKSCSDEVYCPAFCAPGYKENCEIIANLEETCPTCCNMITGCGQ